MNKLVSSLSSPSHVLINSEIMCLVGIELFEGDHRSINDPPEMGLLLGEDRGFNTRCAH